MKREPEALLVSDGPGPDFVIFHDYRRLYRVVRAAPASTMRTVQGLDRWTDLMINCHVSAEALRRTEDGDKLELSGLGLFSLVSCWTNVFGHHDDVRLDRILSERQGLRIAQEWMEETLSRLARDHGDKLTGDIPTDWPESLGRWRAREEWRINLGFWSAVLGCGPNRTPATLILP